MMNARDSAARTLRMIGDIRDAQRQQAVRMARDAQSAADAADSARTTAKQDVDQALAAWFGVAGEGDSFDPTLALSWALALNGREAALRGADMQLAEAQGANERARTDWHAAVMRADQASKAVARAQRYASAYREEKRLVDQADLIAFRSMGQ